MNGFTPALISMPDIYTGDTYRQPFTVGGIDWTSVTDVVLSLQNTDPALKNSYKFSKINNDITVDTSTGLLTLFISLQNTTSYVAGKYNFRIRLYFNSGDVFTLAYGSLNIFSL